MKSFLIYYIILVCLISCSDSRFSQQVVNPVGSTGKGNTEIAFYPNSIRCNIEIQRGKNEINPWQAKLTILNHMDTRIIIVVDSVEVLIKNGECKIVNEFTSVPCSFYGDCRLAIVLEEGVLSGDNSSFVLPMLGLEKVMENSFHFHFSCKDVSGKTFVGKGKITSVANSSDVFWGTCKLEKQ